ncbi:hypothetical protein LZ32DRAFT_602095 [Colletotrichum eremochloae]|nr:hypothetical protein LZ32DRAFT_602095 [Colletotrichum eremochloae]
MKPTWLENSIEDLIGVRSLRSTQFQNRKVGNRLGMGLKERDGRERIRKRGQDGRVYLSRPQHVSTVLCHCSN